MNYLILSFLFTVIATQLIDKKVKPLYYLCILSFNEWDLLLNPKCSK